jgi:hypothetical protein
MLTGSGQNVGILGKRCEELSSFVACRDSMRCFKIYGLDVVLRHIRILFLGNVPFSHFLTTFVGIIPFHLNSMFSLFWNIFTVWLLNFWFSSTFYVVLFWVVTLCSLIKDYRHFSGTSFLNSQIVRLKMEAAGSSETVIITSESTRYWHPDDHSGSAFFSPLESLEKCHIRKLSWKYGILIT